MTLLTTLPRQLAVLMPEALWRALASVVAAVLVYRGVDGAEPLRAGLALFVLIGALWMTQALHLSVTALLVPLLAVLLGLMDLRSALGAFANPVIFLFLGGFALAAALQQQGLDRRLAQALLGLAAGRRPLAVALLLAMTAVMSMWISNTATAAMMLPLSLGLLQEEDGPREKAFVLLGVAYSASIGGIGTLVGRPPNAIAAAQAGIGFAQWLRIGIPMVLVLMPLMVLVLWGVLRPALSRPMRTAGPPEQVGPLTRSQVLTLVIFACTAAGWVAAAPLGRALGIAADMDTVVAIAAIVALVATGVIDWPGIEQRTQWGVLLLFGGGLTLSAVMAGSGASDFLAAGLTGLLQGASPFVLLLAVVTFVVFLTELVSNTASAALLVPIFVGVAAAMGLPPALFATAIAVSASCAFMLPVATPPNAIVYGTGLVPQSTMMRCGLVLNLVCTVAIAGLAYAVHA